VSDLTNSGGYIVRRMMSVDAEFHIMPNAFSRDRRLSYKARGILGELMSHAEGRKVSLQELAEDKDDERDHCEGIAAVRTGINELERYGYLVRENRRSEKGKYGTRWILTEPTVAMFEMPKKAAFDNRTRSDLPFDNRTATAFDNRTNKEHYLRTPVKETAQANHSTGGREIEAQSAQPSLVAGAPESASGLGRDSFDLVTSLQRASTPPEPDDLPTPCAAHKFMPCMPDKVTGICPDCRTNYATGEVA